MLSDMFNKKVGTSNDDGVSDERFTEQVKCDKLRKSDLAKITELQKQLEECHSGKNKPGFVQKVKSQARSLRDRFSQSGGKRKKTKRRRKSKKRRNRKTRRHKR